MLDAGKYENLIRACVFFAPEVPFCLDIQYLLCEAFTRAGAQYATALSIAKREIEDFITKFKGIEFLTFSDGQPFANDTTKEFLINITCLAQGAEFSKICSNGENTVDIVASIRSECAEDISNQDFFSAMTKIHKKALILRGADLLRVKLEAIRLLLNKKHSVAAVAIAYEVEEILDFHKLEQWDLELSQESLKVLRDVWLAQKKSEEGKAKLTQILARLYRLNPTLAFL